MTKLNLVINKREDAAEVLIYDTIGQDLPVHGVSAAEFVDDLRRIDRHEPLDVRINSPGGSVFDGLTIYNLLCDHGGKVRVFVDGLAASIASVIAMSGDEITMAPSARMMIHDPMGPSALAFGTADDLRDAARETEKTARLLESLKSTLVEIYSSRTGNAGDTVAEWMQDETWLTADEAKTRGFADRVMESTPSTVESDTSERVSSGSLATQLAACFDLSMYRNLPAEWTVPRVQTDNSDYRKYVEKLSINRVDRERLAAAARLRLRRNKIQLTTDGL